MILSIPWSNVKYGAQIAFDDSTIPAVKVRSKNKTWSAWKTIAFTDGTIDLISVLCKAGLVATRSEGRRAIEQGGVTLGNDKITDVKAVFSKDTFAGEGAIVKRGKKNFRKVILK